MPTNRHNLILDEQAFQGLLSAAFIVQEYNDRRNHHRLHNDRLNNDRLHNDRLNHDRLNSDQASDDRPNQVCAHCGAAKAAEGSRCESCGRDEFRPGERLQRNWASLWLMSQEQDLWPVRSRELREDTKREDTKREVTKREVTKRDAAPLAVERRPLSQARHDAADSAWAAPAPPLDMTGQARTDTVHDPEPIRSAGDQSAPEKFALRAPAFCESALSQSAFSGTISSETRLRDTTFREPAAHAPAFHAPEFDEPVLGHQALDHTDLKPRTLNRVEAECNSNGNGIDAVGDRSAREAFTPEESDAAVPALQLYASDDSMPTEAGADESTAAMTAAMTGAMIDVTTEVTTDVTSEVTSHVTSDDMTDATNGALTEATAGVSERGTGAWAQQWADLRVILRSHRADLYLGAAVFVAVLALLWPTAGAARRPALSPWERALVNLGLAEVPQPAAHLPGDPAIAVWVDPHTALYYCPGEEQYGKTPDGRLSNQRDAQMDRFQPSSRSACE